MESVHNILKVVAGAPNLRPAWFFDTEEQGEALADVGTHLVDLAAWLLFPEQALDYRSELRLVSARRWPTALSGDQLRRVTGLKAARPPSSRRACRATGSRTSRTARPRGACAAPTCGCERSGTTRRRRARATPTPPSFAAAARGSRFQQAAEQKWLPELYVIANQASDAAELKSALERRVAELAKAHPGLAVADEGSRLRVVIPERYRVGHEAHFAEVTERFLGYLKDPAALPGWENANMLAKYRITTEATEASRR